MSQAQNTTFTRLQVQRLRKKAERARGADTLELPDGITDAWSVADLDPMTVLRAFPSLRIRYGFRLGAYQYASSVGGHALVWAIPENSPLPSVEPGCSYLTCPHLCIHIQS